MPQRLKIEVPAPLFISARLMAAVKLQDGSQLHVEWTGRTDSCGRDQVHYIVEASDGTELANASDMHVRGGYVEAVATLATFLSAAAESYSYRMRTGREGENESLFPPECVEWAYQHSDELGMLKYELENPDETDETATD